MMNPNLSAQQFAEVDSPLPYSEGTNSSSKAASAWRKPRGLSLPLGNQTFGTVWRPFEGDSAAVPSQRKQEMV